ncbi:MAG: response regulator transcription factor [Bacteroidota bacterium]|nr:response regulator transcription factor [Bacteroidota bacterium]
MEKIRITIADSNFLSRKGLAVLLRENPDFDLVSQSLSTTDLIAQSKLISPDLIIIDYSSANFSLEGLSRIVKKYPDTKFLAITDVQPNNVISTALSTGINSHLLKDCDEEEIIEAIYKTAIGEKFMCGKITSAIVEDNKSISRNEYSCAGLNISEREMEIIKLIAEGYSNKEVADKLFLSTHTVTTHRKNIMNKLGVNNTAGLVLFAVRENLISPNHFLFSASN